MESDFSQAQNPSPLAADLAAFADMRARILQEGRDEAESKYKAQLQAAYQEIERLKSQLAHMTDSTPATESQPVYPCNTAHFNRPNAPLIINIIIALANSKRENGKYIIQRKTDWYIVWKILHYFKYPGASMESIYIGSEYNFVDLVTECVIPHIHPQERRQALLPTKDNIKSISSSNPMKSIPVLRWRKELQRELEERSNHHHGTLSLDRALNIKVRLQELLQTHSVNIINYEPG